VVAEPVETAGQRRKPSRPRQPESPVEAESETEAIAKAEDASADEVQAKRSWWKLSPRPDRVRRSRAEAAKTKRAAAKVS
jgi:hypothetical protein